jgi:hypothetical protein
MLQIKFADNPKTQILCSFFFFFFFIFFVYEIIWENIVEPGRPDDNMAHAHCMLDN